MHLKWIFEDAIMHITGRGPLERNVSHAEQELSVSVQTLHTV